MPDRRAQQPGQLIDNACGWRGWCTAADDHACRQGMGLLGLRLHLLRRKKPLGRGELGVHQISAEVSRLVMAQTTLGDVLDAHRFLWREADRHLGHAEDARTCTSSRREEIIDLEIAGEPIRVANSIIGAAPPLPIRRRDCRCAAAKDTSGAAAQTAILCILSSQKVKQGEPFARICGRDGPASSAAVPRSSGDGEWRHAVPYPRAGRSMENANALCAAIKSAGGGCS